MQEQGELDGEEERLLNFSQPEGETKSGENIFLQTTIESEFDDEETLAEKVGEGLAKIVNGRFTNKLGDEALKKRLLDRKTVSLNLFGDNLAISVKEMKELDRLSTRSSLHPDKRTHNGYGNLFQGDDSRVFRGNHHRRPLLDNTSEVCLDGLGPPQAERRPAA